MAHRTEPRKEAKSHVLGRAVSEWEELLGPSSQGALANGHLIIFAATRREDVPAGVERYLSVDGSVPGFLERWDHHVTGERINLDCMPDHIDAAGVDGVGTTLVDMDAVASVVCVLLGGRARIPEGARHILEAASHYCDHLVAHPGLDDESNRRGERLLAAFERAVSEARIAGAPSPFADWSRGLAGLIARGLPLPEASPDDAHAQRARELLDGGRLRVMGQVALVDLRSFPPVDPSAVYRLHACPVAVAYECHERGGMKYTVGINPFVADAPTDLGPALRALAAAEFEHGPPARAPDPVAGAENWGGRATVFGSPWNYGSRLTPEAVVATVAASLFVARS